MRDALHIPAEAPSWDSCNSSAGFDYSESRNGSLWVYRQLRGKYRILKYSGDSDGVVPTYGTQQWIEQENWPITNAWRPIFLNDQVVGYIENREGDFTFATVHGAGHMVPQWKRPEAFNLMFKWINKLDL